MRVVLFYHSFVSDWNHGNAHFLRGIATELVSRGHAVAIYEPKDGWSRQNLLAEYGLAPLEQFHAAYPQLDSTEYDLANFDLDRALDGANLVLVHEWNDHELVRRVGEHRARAGGYTLLFHDTHHRALTDRAHMAAYDLRHYDGVLAYGRVIRDIYLQEGWTRRAWTWHEAADTRVFCPRPDLAREGDLVWIGNGGDEERTAELNEFLIEPARALGLRARVYGVRYPEPLRAALRDAQIDFAGWTPNFRVPQIFARFRVTIHIPRRPYVRALPGIPTIRPFEALACGIPLVSAPWDDVEGLFTPGADYWVARDGAEMQRHLRTLLNEPDTARALAEHGRRTLLARHTCAHRVDELLDIFTELTTANLGINALE
ncbi:MAG: glycosyltransferase [Chloroflexi bacterium]|nr:glycosyltransferase [Chloroflexota bacterium]